MQHLPSQMKRSWPWGSSQLHHMRSTTQTSTLSFLPRELSTFQMWDETLADSSQLNKASCKLGGGRKRRNNKKRGPNKFKPQVQKPKWVTIGQRNKSMWGFVLGKTYLWDIIMGGRKKAKKNELPRDWKPTWLSTWMDCLSSFENSMQDSHPTHTPTIHLHFLFTFGILPSGRCIQISATNSGTNTTHAI